MIHCKFIYFNININICNPNKYFYNFLFNNFSQAKQPQLWTCQSNVEIIISYNQAFRWWFFRKWIWTKDFSSNELKINNKNWFELNFFFQLSLKTLTSTNSSTFFTILNGIEHLLLSEKFTIKNANDILKIAFENFKNANSQLISLSLLKLITSTTYFSKFDHKILF